MDIAKQVVILSAEKTGKTQAENLTRTENLIGILNDIDLPFKQTIGAFNHVTQQSFVVIINDEQDVDFLKNIAFKTLDQTAIVLQDANRQAHLITNTGESTNIGKLDVVTKEVALNLGNYTIMNDQYYSTIN